jgi:hypothetical protein
MYTDEYIYIYEDFLQVSILKSFKICVCVCVRVRVCGV